jgi:hypothetical protein
MLDNSSFAYTASGSTGYISSNALGNERGQSHGHASGHFPLASEQGAESLEDALAGAEARLLEQVQLVPCERLKFFLAMARNSRHVLVREQAFVLALRAQRVVAGAAVSGSMATAQKIKTCETPVLELFLEFGRLPQWMPFVVRLLADNEATGSGHLSVNRAKQALKELAKSIGFVVLVRELASAVSERRTAAIHLLGWLKQERAIEPLVYHFAAADCSEKELVSSVLETHYISRLSYYLRWRTRDIAAADGLLAICEKC